MPAKERMWGALITNSKHHLWAFAYGAALSAPISYLAGMLTYPDFILVETLFLLNLLLSGYLTWKRFRPSRPADVFSRDYYLSDLDLRGDPLYRLCDFVVFMLGAPAAFLFDLFVTVISLVSLLAPTLASQIREYFEISLLILLIGLPLSLLAIVLNIASDAISRKLPGGKPG